MPNIIIPICCLIFSEAGSGSASIGLGTTYGVEKDCLLSEENGIGLENDLRRDDNFEVWEYRGGNCRNTYNRDGYGNLKTYMLLKGKYLELSILYTSTFFIVFVKVTTEEQQQP